MESYRYPSALQEGNLGISQDSCFPLAAVVKDADDARLAKRQVSIAERVDMLIRHNGRSMAEFIRRAHVDRTTVIAWRDGQKPQAKTVQSVATNLKYRVDDLHAFLDAETDELPDRLETASQSTNTRVAAILRQLADQLENADNGVSAAEDGGAKPSKPAKSASG